MTDLPVPNHSGEPAHWRLPQLGVTGSRNKVAIVLQKHNILVTALAAADKTVHRSLCSSLLVSTKQSQWQCSMSSP